MYRRTIRIYTLTNPENGLIFYVGRTTSALHQRLSKNHFKSKNCNCNPKFRDYLLEMDKKGLKPIIEEIDRTHYDNRRIVEEYWIQQIAAWGFELMNVKHYDNRNHVQYEKRAAFNAIDIGVFDRLYRNGDFTEIARTAKTTDMTVRKYFGKIKVPVYLKEPIQSFYLNRAKEISDWYQMNNKIA